MIGITNTIKIIRKILDLNESGYTNLKLKVFEINYEKFHEIYS